MRTAYRLMLSLSAVWYVTLSFGTRVRLGVYPQLWWELWLILTGVLVVAAAVHPLWPWLRSAATAGAAVLLAFRWLYALTHWSGWSTAVALMSWTTISVMVLGMLTVGWQAFIEPRPRPGTSNTAEGSISISLFDELTGVGNDHGE